MTELNSEFSPFAARIRDQKYAHVLGDGRLETWKEISRRVATHVLGAVNAPQSLIDETAHRIEMRQFIPGGRYLYATGRPLHQVNNCVLLRAEDSREGWADLMHKSAMALMTGAGEGINYSYVREEVALIRRTGGTATGPIALAKILNEQGRGIMQGGARRSAIWGGLSWKHPDILKWIHLKDWPDIIKKLKAQDFNFPATMDGTNISVCLNDEFFAAYDDVAHPKHSLAHKVYWDAVTRMLKTGEPGFGVDVGANAGEDLRNAPVARDTHVVTDKGIVKVGDVVEQPITVWTGKQWAYDVVFKQTGTAVPTVTVEMTGNRFLKCEPSHPFMVERYVGAGRKRRLVAVDRLAASDLQQGDILHVSLPATNMSRLSLPVYADAYAMGFLYGDGSFREDHAELSICDDTKAPCGVFIKQHCSLKWSPMNDKRGFDRMYFAVNHAVFAGRNKETFPEDFRTGGANVARAFVAGLFDADGSYDPVQHRIRLSSAHFEFLRDCQRVLEWLGIQSNISVGSESGYKEGRPSWQLVIAAGSVTDFAHIIPTIRLQPQPHKAYRPFRIKVLSVRDSGREDVFCADVKVPEHTFMAEGVIISNCTEVTSADDSDICNLGSINMARVETLEDMRALVEIGTYFLLAGTVYSDVPYPKICEVRMKNRRLGLGLMGLHEWLLIHGKKYGPDPELQNYLNIYASSGLYACDQARQLSLSSPVKTRAIAPNGTIGIVAETTTSAEPIFCAAYKRRYLKGTVWQHEYVIDPTAKKLVESGIASDRIEDAYSITPERRVEFQAWLQQYVDHGISSTVNLPAWGSEGNNESTVKDFGTMLMKYLPNLRGITCYPDGARGGQPLTPVRFSTAIKHIGEVFVEAVDICDITKAGSCG